MISANTRRVNPIKRIDSDPDERKYKDLHMQKNLSHLCKAYYKRRILGFD